MNVAKLMDFLEGQGFSPDLVEGDTEIVIACPLCFDERKRLYISADQGLFICFHCDERGHLTRLLTDVCDLTVSQALTFDRELRVRGQRPPLPAPRHVPPPAEVALPTGFLTDGGVGIVREYFRFRHLSPEWIRPLGVGYCLTGPYHHRVIVPVYTEGQLRTFVARTWVSEERKKVLMPKGSQAARALFGYDGLPQPTEEVILVEGVWDAMKLWEQGLTGAVATLGAHITELQRALLKQRGVKRVILLRDGDEAGRKAMAKEAQELAAAMLEVSVALLPEGTDPGSATVKQIKKALDEAQDITVILGQEVALYGQTTEARR